MAAATQDRLDAAIAAAEPTQPATATLDLIVGPDRVVTIQTPIDLTPQEAINFIGAIARDLPRALIDAAIRSQGVRMIETPQGPHLVRPT